MPHQPEGGVPAPVPTVETAPSGAKGWLLRGLSASSGTHPGPHAESVEKTNSWWRVTCLTGADYFSTLGYQPAIAAVTAGLLSPFATVVLVALTLLGALPVYRRVARESFRGEGSISILERPLLWWGGKLFVLVLLGFAATDFMITITLLAADATAHAIGNHFSPSWFEGNQVVITLVFVALLAAVFPVVIGNWWNALTTQHSNPLAMVGIALLVFPKPRWASPASRRALPSCRRSPAGERTQRTIRGGVSMARNDCC